MSYGQHGRYTGLTPAEKAFLISQPWTIPFIKLASDEARAEAQRRFPGAGLHNGQGDAFRHCYASAMLARDIGVVNARLFTNAHEAFAGNPPGEKTMDLHNNAVGIALGAGRSRLVTSNASLARACNQALVAGWLMTTPSTAGSAYGY